MTDAPGNELTALCDRLAVDCKKCLSAPDFNAWFETSRSLMSDVPTLIAAIRTLQADNAALREELKDLNNEFDAAYASWAGRC